MNNNTVLQFAMARGVGDVSLKKIIHYLKVSLHFSACCFYQHTKILEIEVIAKIL
jgi:hypothetical protein